MIRNLISTKMYLLDPLVLYGLWHKEVTGLGVGWGGSVCGPGPDPYFRRWKS